MGSSRNQAPKPRAQNLGRWCDKGTLDNMEVSCAQQARGLRRVDGGEAGGCTLDHIEGHIPTP